jgi:hypothetical protein
MPFGFRLGLLNLPTSTRVKDPGFALFDRINDLCDMGFDDRPANSGKRNQRYRTARQVLFIVQRSITRNENVETSSFSSIEKLAVLVASKASIVSC